MSVYERQELLNKEHTPTTTALRADDFGNSPGFYDPSQFKANIMSSSQNGTTMNVLHGQPQERAHSIDDDLNYNDSRRYPQPLSVWWRLYHFLLYLNGGVTFLVGSICFMSQYANYEAAGWLFTLGSFTFLCADLSEWWKNNKVGCAFDGDQRDEFEETIGKYYGSPSTCGGWFWRAETGLNFFLSANGSFWYLVGSIMFIPATNLESTGNIIFILASAVIMMAQSWKLLRQGQIDPSQPPDAPRRWDICNYWSDLSGMGVDLGAFLGAWGYLYGGVLFLPGASTSWYGDGYSDPATVGTDWFVFGGSFYLFSGICMGYRYWFTQNYPH